MVMGRLLGVLLLTPMLWAAGPAVGASAQEAPPPPTDPVQTILGVFSPFTTEPCSVVGIAGALVPVPGYGQVLNVCAQFPLPTQRSTCIVDAQIPGALPVQVPLPLPTPVGSVVDSAAAAQNAVGSATGRPPPDVAGPLGENLQCAPTAPPSLDGEAVGPPPEASQLAPSPTAVEGAAIGDTGSALASLPASSSVENAYQPVTNAAAAPASAAPAIEGQAAVLPVGSKKDSNGGVYLGVILVALVIAAGCWVFAASSPASVGRAPA
jgi:hypothetical protein